LTFYELKILILEITYLSRDAMHVHVGMAIFILVWLLWRWRGARLIAWLAALAAALGGEWLDHQIVGEVVPDYIWTEHWRDIFSTMLWPTILSLFAGVLPYFMRKKKHMENEQDLIKDDDDQ